MPAQAPTTGFRFIDTYNHIREDLQAGRDYEEELDSLEQQQGVPQFSSSSSSSPLFPPTTTTTITNATQPTLIHNNHLQEVTPTPTPYPTPSPSPRSYSPAGPSPCPSPAVLSPHCPPSEATQPYYNHSPSSSSPSPSSQQSSAEGGDMMMMNLMTQDQDQNQFGIFPDMEVSASFLEELIGQPSTSSSTLATLTPLQPSAILTPMVPSSSSSSSSSSTTSTTTTTSFYVAEAAAAGCTVVQTSAPVPADQQLLTDMDMVDLYDLDKHGRSFYDDLPAAGAVVVDSKTKEGALPGCDYFIGSGGGIIGRDDMAASWVADLDLAGGQVGSGSESCLTELGAVVGSEQEDLLSAFDSFRKDILQDCRELSLSPDPRAWSAQDSQAWVTYMLDKSQRPDDCSACLAVTGSVLCQKSEEQLLWISPSNGSFLRQQLDTWLAVADFPDLPSKQQQQPFTTTTTITPSSSSQSPPQSGATLSHLPPCVSPAPSTDSGCGSERSSSSSSSSSSSPSSSLSSSLSSSMSSLSPSDVTMSFWCRDGSETEDMFSQDSSTDSNPSEQLSSSSSSTTKTSPTTGRQAGSRGAGKQIRLWEFLRELLEKSDPAIKWLDRARGVFKIEDSNRVARLWGQRKNHPAMNYDKLSRSVRQYYKKGIIKKTTQTRRLVYQFCERYL